jgi:hypothetical protein
MEILVVTHLYVSTMNYRICVNINDRSSGNGLTEEDGIRQINLNRGRKQDDGQHCSMQATEELVYKTETVEQPRLKHGT